MNFFRDKISSINVVLVNVVHTTFNGFTKLLEIKNKTNSMKMVDSNFFSVKLKKLV